jgi:dihydroxy-acid dehydratase
MKRPRKQPEELRSHRWFWAEGVRPFTHRSRTKQLGFSTDDFKGKPVIAILNTWSDANTCHAHFRDARGGGEARRLAGGRLPARDAGALVGESYMKPTPDALSQPARDGRRGAAARQPDRRRVLMGGCDKTVPGLLMGAISMNVPAIFVSAGPMLRGNWRGGPLASGSDQWKYWAEKRAGNLDECAWREIEDGIARSPGTCMTMGTASTMAAAAEALGMMLPGGSSIPAVDSNHARLADYSGRRIVEMVFEDLKPRDILTQQAFDNAVTVTMALGGLDQRDRAPGRAGGADGRAVRHRPLRRAVPAHAVPRQHPALGQVPDGGLLLRGRDPRRHVAALRPAAPGRAHGHRQDGARETSTARSSTTTT